MLQRAASNAYSWWWASHIRTKQSKWLEQNLQDMEEKVASVLKLIEEDGDSFARRAEMYYKKRPELIHFVEESYRAYRALAERYDHISTELQNANNTIASVFPEQVQFMDDEDEDGPPSFPRKPSDNLKGNVPKVPKLPTKDLKSIISAATKKMQPNNKIKAAIAAFSKSGLTKAEGLLEIDRLQKRILALQTEKEFVKSSYDAWLAKYWEIENEIKEMQEKVCSLQDEFGEGRIIEDDEARTLMASTALQSCQQTLDQLQEKQERSILEAEVEQKRIKDAREKLDSLKNSFSLNETTADKPSAGDKSGKAVEKSKRSEQEGSDAKEKKKEMESLRKKIKEHFEVSLGESLSVTEMAEKIDELVNKVINLETAVSSQTALIQRLRTETDELQAQIRTLEDDKASLRDGKNDLRKKLREMEEKLKGIQDLNQNVEDQNNNLQNHFTEAHCNLDALSGKVQSVKPDEELEGERGSSKDVKSSKKKAKDSDKKTEELEREKGKKKSKDSDKKPNKVEAGKESGVSDASEKESSLAEAIPQKEPEERESIGGKKVQIAKPEETVTGSSQKEENSRKVEAPQELERKGEKPDHEDGLTKGDSEKTEGRKDVKERDSITTSTNEAGVSQETSKPSEKSKDLTAENKVGEQVSSQAANTPTKVESKEQERGPKVESKEQERGAKVESKEQERGAKVESKEQERGANFESKEQEREQEDEPDWKQLYLKSVEDIEKRAKVESKEEESWEKDEPDWKQLYLKGMKDREKNLVAEYTTMLRNYKETKKNLTEVETKNQNGLFEITLQLRELKSTNATKDEEIRLLRHKLSLFEAGMGEKKNADQCVEPRVKPEKSVVSEPSKTLLPIEKEDDDDDLGLLLINQTQTTSEIEERFRMNIDELLEENLDFWLRFSTAFHEVQNFETSVKDLMDEALKLGERQKQEGSSTTKYSVKSDVRPLYKHLRELQTELTVWVEKSVMLKEELKNRFSSLCDIQEEITKALKASAEDDDFVFTSYQAAKFQGEILNMKQENNKVADELQAGLDHVTTLQLETERTLAKLSEDWGLSGSKSRQSGHLQHSDSRSRIPLRSFIFGTKPKKQKSIFSCVHPALHWKHSGLKSGHSSSR